MSLTKVRIRAGDRAGRALTSVRRRRPIRDVASIQLCGARNTGRLALTLFPLNELDPDLGIVTPDGLACSDGRFARPQEIEYCGDTSRGLNL